ncbi:MAG: caspase family protein [Bacteroidia bacterium]|nr:caspase family protein [Bacteroidia bacterium]
MEYRFRLFALFILIGGFVYGQNDLTVLNGFRYIVVKPNNKHIEYSEQIKSTIESKLKERGFLEILDASALYSKDYNQCEIVTCEYNLTIISGTNPEMLTQLNFLDCKYTLIHSSKEKNKYTFFNEKSTVKNLSKHLGIFDTYNYKYEPKKEELVVRETVNLEKSETSEKPLQANPDTSSLPGKFYALLIGISDYSDPSIPDLDQLPEKDADKLADVLLTNYTFQKEDMVLLKNPTRREIVIALDNLSKQVTGDDNVLIFYAGHGHYEEESQLGYWLPKDSEVENTSNWLYNDQLVASLKKIKSKHTLLISDACFSGSIFKSRSVNMQNAGDALKKKYDLPSRKAITSGTLKTVPNISVFMKYLVDRLAHNPENYFSASQLFQSIEIPVGNNSPTTPQYGVIQNVGDEGGDFIFIRK